MNDCDGNELRVGDRVAAQMLHYKELKVCPVLGFTPKMVKIMYAGSHRNVDPFRLAKLFNQGIEI